MNSLSHSWSHITTEAEEAEICNNYVLALKLWQHAYRISTLTFNKNLASAKIQYCIKRIDMNKQLQRIVVTKGTEQLKFKLSEDYYSYILYKGGKR